jgi:hypothetical protein
MKRARAELSRVLTPVGPTSPTSAPKAERVRSHTHPKLVATRHRLPESKATGGYPIFGGPPPTKDCMHESMSGKAVGASRVADWRVRFAAVSTRDKTVGHG